MTDKAKQGVFYRKRMYPKNSKLVTNLGRITPDETVEGTLAVIRSQETMNNDSDGSNIFFVEDPQPAWMPQVPGESVEQPDDNLKAAA